MAVSDETRRALREMGLTDYESRAYLILLTLGTMNASQLSNLADLPYSKVYNVLKSLERKGWINVEDG
ncbi:MAG: TrmB family transcriptional regulator, partial [Candidatus Bathyarchaeia archaeon]